MYESLGYCSQFSFKLIQCGAPLWYSTPQWVAFCKSLGGRETRNWPQFQSKSCQQQVAASTLDDWDEERDHCYQNGPEGSRSG